MDDYELEHFRWRQRRRIGVVLALGVIGSFLQRSPDRRVWVHPYISRRQQHGAHHNLFMELRMENPDKFRRCLRMSSSMFDWLTEKIRPLVERKDTHLRRSIPVDERLSVTLRHLATGETQESLSYLYRLGQTTISGILKSVCIALYEVLHKEHLRFPSSAAEWKVVAADFGERWNFHNCIGAMDGKHIVIEPPIASGSLYYNYKHTYSIVLLAMVDAQLRFVFADVGTNGRISDKGVWNKCALKKQLDNNHLNLPDPCPLPGTQTPFPYVIVVDEGFSLSPRVLIPYPKEQLSNRKDRRIFNYRSSRARRCSENAFGVMANRFQIFRSPLRYDPDKAKNIVMAVLCLHNLLRSDAEGRRMYTTLNILDREDEATGQRIQGEWRDMTANGTLPLHHQAGNRHANDAIFLRSQWAEYFNGPGSVPWQERMIGYQGN